MSDWILCRDDEHLQRELDSFSHRYNYRRPHEALGMLRPADRYRPSTRSMPKVLLPIIYGEGIQTRRVDRQGKIGYAGHKLRVGMGCSGMLVGLRPVPEEKLEVYFCKQMIALIDLSNGDDPRVTRTTRRRAGTGTNPRGETENTSSARVDSALQRRERRRTR